ncbi:MAG: hypothetical protein PHW52_00970 [Candidatus Pacebacteria bacterium]|nr:hypothetical protein [Candidatus Paceibacterota bacterium]
METEESMEWKKVKMISLRAAIELEVMKNIILPGIAAIIFYIAAISWKLDNETAIIAGGGIWGFFLIISWLETAFK